jgi:hypothetical protein
LDSYQSLPSARLAGKGSRDDTAAAGKDKNAAMRDLTTHAQDNRDLISQITARALGPSGDNSHGHR